MLLHGRLGYVELVGYFLVAQPLGDVIQYVHLTIGEGSENFLMFVGARGLGPFDSAVEVGGRHHDHGIAARRERDRRD